MQIARTRERTTRHEEPADALSATGGPSTLLEQSQGFAAVAREAVENSALINDAEFILQTRRNRSGQ